MSARKTHVGNDIRPRVSSEPYSDTPKELYGQRHRRTTVEMESQRRRSGPMTLFEILPSLRHFAPRIDCAIWPLTAHVDELSRLCVGDVPLTEVADEFGHPTYVIDEADFRHRIRRYRAVLPDVRLVYAGKSLLTTAVAQWVAGEGGRLGVCSGGELATALVAGVDQNQIVMHGSATTFGELCKAASVGSDELSWTAP
jgi:diaminopimelate decarboxylase